MRKVLHLLTVGFIVCLSAPTFAETKKSSPLTARFFPLNLYLPQIHAGADLPMNDHWAIGGEAGVMTSVLSVGSYFTGKPHYKYRENYFGVYGQYYFSPNLSGFFVEAGANVLFADIEYSVDTSYTIAKSGSFFMPHASINYRLRMSGSRLSSSFGLGFYSLIGEALSYEDREYYVDNTSAVVTKTSDYAPVTRLRLRFDIGYTF